MTADSANGDAVTVNDEQVDAALDELLIAGGRFTQVLLGARGGVGGVSNSKSETPVV